MHNAPSRCRHLPPIGFRHAFASPHSVRLVWATRFRYGTLHTLQGPAHTKHMCHLRGWTLSIPAGRDLISTGLFLQRIISAPPTHDPPQVALRVVEWSLSCPGGGGGLATNQTLPQQNCHTLQIQIHMESTMRGKERLYDDLEIATEAWKLSFAYEVAG